MGSISPQDVSIMAGIFCGSFSLSVIDSMAFLRYIQLAFDVRGTVMGHQFFGEPDG